MKRYVATFIVSFLLYLALVAAWGPVAHLWSYQEIIAGIVVGVVVALTMSRFFCEGSDFRMANPVRWLWAILYIGPFFWGMLRANVDVAIRVITGKIRPGIVKISPGLKRDLAVTLLANSITLTPGTLTVDVDEEKNLYIHWIYVKKGKEKPKPEDVCGSFPKWARRIAE
jgi:multicomponent Na+:H+ antiporter subunit E